MLVWIEVEVEGVLSNTFLTDHRTKVEVVMNNFEIILLFLNKTMQVM